MRDEWGEVITKPLVHNLTRVLLAPRYCETSVTRKGEEDSCEKTAVAVITMYFDGEWVTWPVCAYHAHMLGGRDDAALVPLLALLQTAVADSEGGERDE